MTTAKYDILLRQLREQDTITGGASGASSITYDPTGTGLVATNVQDAITESVDKRFHTSTGLLDGGDLSINIDTTKFDIADGNGVVVDMHTDPNNPTYTPVSWSGLTAQTVTNIATHPVSYIAIDSAGAVYQTTQLITRDGNRDYIVLGALTHFDNINVDGVANFTTPIINPQLQTEDLAVAVGSINVSGNDFSANGANLNIDKSVGEVYTSGVNWSTSKKNPNYITVAADTALTFSYTYDDGAGGWTTTASTTSVDPSIYDDGTGTPGTVETYQWSIQRIFFETAGATIIHLGTDVYNNKEAAIAAINSEDFTRNPLLEGFIRRTALVVKGDATDLSDMDQAVFYEYDKFGGLIANTGVAKGVTNLFDFANGAVLDDQTQTITESGGTVYFNIERDGGGDLYVQFHGENYIFDSTPTGQIALTAGTDAAPQINYIYFTRSGSTVSLTKSTTAFPTSGEFAPLASILVQSAASVASYGPYKHHAWINELGDGTGHLLDINKWIRLQNASYVSGVTLTPTITVNPAAQDNIDIATSSGVILQLHQHTFPAFDTSIASSVYIVNKNGAAYTRITDLNAANEDSAGNVITNGKYIQLVLFGTVSENSTDSKVYVNLPSAINNIESNAIADSTKKAVYTMPADFKGTSFLIARLVLKYTSAASGTWALIHQEDLRGLLPSVSPGGTTAQNTTFVDSTFKIVDETDSSKILQFQNSGISTLTTRTLTVPDANGTIITTGNLTGITGTGALNSGSITSGFGSIDLGADTFTTTGLITGGTASLTATNSLNLGTGSSATGQIVYKNSTNANTVTVQPGATSASYTLTLPTAVGGAGTVLTDVAGDGVLSWAAAAGGLTWGDSITSTSGTGITTTIANNSDAGTIGQSIVIGNTQTNSVTGLKVDTGTDASPIQTGINIIGLNAYGIRINEFGSATQGVINNLRGILAGLNFNTNTALDSRLISLTNEKNAGGGNNIGIYLDNKGTATNDVGLRLIQTGVAGTVVYLTTASNVNSSTNGLVNYTLSNTQSGATVMQKIDLGTSVQAHTGLYILAEGASSGQIGMQIDSDDGINIALTKKDGGAGDWITFSQAANEDAGGDLLFANLDSGGNSAALDAAFFNITMEGLHKTTARTIPAAQFLYTQYGNQNENDFDQVYFYKKIEAVAGNTPGNSGGSVLKLEAAAVETTGAIDDFADNLLELAVSGNRNYKWDGSAIEAVIATSGTPTTARTVNFLDFDYSRTNTATSGTVADDYDLGLFKRTSIQNGAGGTLTAAGSVAHFENVATQTAGTLTDSVAVIKLTQDNNSTGGHILMNAYSGTPTTDGTVWNDGTNLKVRLGGTTYTLDMTAV